MDTFLQAVLDKLSFENKSIVLQGDFNIYFLHYESHSQTTDFLDQMYLGLLSPQTTIPTRISPHSRILIVDIFF